MRLVEGLGTRLFVTCCYSGGYKMVSSQPALFGEGWELVVLQVIENQLSKNRTVPNLCKPISGQDHLHCLLRLIVYKC